VADIGRGAAHVEADQPVEPAPPARCDHADDAARRPRQDRVAPWNSCRIGQPAVRLHEIEPVAAALPEIERIGTCRT
jgi:hypothetical protein